MKLSISLIAALLVSVIIAIQHRSLDQKSRRSLIARAGSLKRPDSETFADPRLEADNPQSGKTSPGTKSSHEIADTKPGFEYGGPTHLTGDKVPSESERKIYKWLKEIPSEPSFRYLGRSSSLVDWEKFRRELKTLETPPPGEWTHLSKSKKETSTEREIMERLMALSLMQSTNMDDPSEVNEVAARVAPSKPREQSRDRSPPKTFWSSGTSEDKPAQDGSPQGKTFLLPESPGIQLPLPVETGKGTKRKYSLYARSLEEWERPRSQRLVKRKDPVSDLESQQSQTAASTTKSDLSNEFERYIGAFEATQSKMSDLILPVLDEMLNGTNCSLVFDAAWSIYSDLTGFNPIIIGPFLYGMHSLDWIEDQLFGNGTYSTAMTEGEHQYQTQVLAIHAVLLDRYNTGWNKAFAAVNGSGLLQDLVKLSRYLSTDDTSIMPAGFANRTSPIYNYSYFTTYNATMGG